jgi:hypothetical protein
MDQPERWVERSIKMLEEQGFSLDCIQRKVLPAGQISLATSIVHQDSIEMNAHHFT